MGCLWDKCLKRHKHQSLQLASTTPESKENEKKSLINQYNSSTSIISKVNNNWDNYFTDEQLNYYKAKYENEMYGLPVSINSIAAHEKIRKGECIGEGAYGKVYLGFNEENGSMMAIKEININKLSSQKENVVQSFKNEIDVLSKLHHKNIIKYYGAYEKGDKLNILLEYCIAGSLYKLLEVYHHFKENIIRKFTFQILKGIEYLHSHNIIHRDIKCANILIDRDGICKLSDFGGAKIVRDPHDIQKSPIEGTPNWMAPEIIKKGEATRFSDIWSIGCTIIEMYQGKPPWSNYYTPLSVMNCIYHAKKPPDIPAEASPEMKDFLSKCLQMEPSKRWNVNQLINHPFIKKLPQKIRDQYDENDELLQNDYFLDRHLIYAPMRFNIEDKDEIKKQCRYRGSKFKSENYDTKAPRTMNSMIELESV